MRCVPGLQLFRNSSFAFLLPNGNSRIIGTRCLSGIPVATARSPELALICCRHTGSLGSALSILSRSSFRDLLVRFGPFRKPPAGVKSRQETGGVSSPDGHAGQLYRTRGQLAEPKPPALLREVYFSKSGEA